MTTKIDKIIKDFMKWSDYEDISEDVCIEISPIWLRKILEKHLPKEEVAEERWMAWDVIKQWNGKFVLHNYEWDCEWWEWKKYKNKSEPKKIAPLEIDSDEYDIYDMRKKINEIILHLNKE